MILVTLPKPKLHRPMFNVVFVYFPLTIISSITGNNTGFSVVNGSNSRRQSNIPRIGDNESTCSLQGRLRRDYSPKSIRRNRAIDRLPLYLNGEESPGALEQPDSLNSACCGISSNTSSVYKEKNQLDCIQKKPLAMVRPRQILSSIASSCDDYERFRGCIESETSRRAGGLRESLSLDPFPNHLRRRVECSKLPKLRHRSACSLDAAGTKTSREPLFHEDINIDGNRTRIINNDFKHHRTLHNNELTKQPCEKIATTTCSTQKSIFAKRSSNDCNGSIGTEDPNSPLLQRQGSLNNPHDEILIHKKRWRSLETIGGLVDNNAYFGHDGVGGGGGNKKVLNRNSIRSWLFGLFQGSGFRSNDASLRKDGVGILQTGGVRGFTELPPAPEQESIV